MLARDTSNKFQQLYYVNKSLGLLDKSVKESPTNSIIRMIRGNVSYAIPEMFGRRKTAFTDYKYLVDNFKLDGNLLSMLYYRLCVLSKNENQVKQANTYFQSSINASKQSKWASRATEALKNN